MIVEIDNKPTDVDWCNGPWPIKCTVEIESGDDTIIIDIWNNALSILIDGKEDSIECELNEKLGFKDVEIAWLNKKFTDMNGDSSEQKECEEFNLL